MVRLPKAVMSWSGGKDSALCLYEALNNYEIFSLITTTSEKYQRVSMHGIREEVIRKQAEVIGLPLKIIRMPEMSSNHEYSTIFNRELLRFKNRGIDYVIFGDIFLEDLKVWRERQIQKINMIPIFPLWQFPTEELSTKFVQLGFKGYPCCIDNNLLDLEFIYKELNSDFFQSLPNKIDPCGENGEFHSIIFDGPIFNQPLKLIPGEIVKREMNVKSNCLNGNSETRNLSFTYRDFNL